jgi:competence protein ComEC
MKQWIRTENILPTVAILLVVGAAIFSLLASRVDTVLAPYAGQRVSVEGVVVRDPDTRDTTQRLTVTPTYVNQVPIAESRNIIVTTERFHAIAYGDRIEVRGVLRAPQPFETDTNRIFDYPRYLWAHGVSYELPFADVTVISSGNGNAFFEILFEIKHALIRGIERALPEPYAALAGGLLLGEKQSLGSALYDAFVASGVVHIIVLSGYNVALIIHAVLYITLRFFPAFVAYGVAGFFVIAFAFLTGASETTIRATIMALFMMVARVLHRPAVALRGLLFASALMALYNPYLVLYDLSFQLSVIATFGLIVLTDPIARRIRFIPERFGFREIIASTVATQIAVLPLLIFSIGAVSLVFLPANALILPVVPLAMLFSFVAGLGALIFPVLALPFSFVAYGILVWIIAVAEFFGAIPFALITIPESLSLLVLGGIGLCYGTVLFFFKMKLFK